MAEDVDANTTGNLFYRAELYINDERVTDLSIPHGVTQIGAGAFNNFSNITSLSLPASVKTVGDDAFYKCGYLENITFDSNSQLEAIGKRAFYGCNISNIALDANKNLTTIGVSAFDNCWSLESVAIPSSVTNIGSNAFYYCENIDSVYITDLAAWCNVSFGGLAANPMTYGADLYLNGEIVTDLVIPNGVTEIKDYAFQGCTSITSVTIPEGCTSIGENAFRECINSSGSSSDAGACSLDEGSNITSISLPSSITSIGSWAFFGCHNITSVHITDLTAWCNISFDDNLSNPMNCGADLYLNGTKVTEVTIPAGTKTIGKQFSGCTSITSVTIPEGCTSIGDNAFDRCSNLTSIEIPSSVTSIGSFAFWGCYNIASIEIPSSVTSIGDDAFNSCHSLTSIVIPNSVTSIGSWAFVNCDNLTIYCEATSKPSGWADVWTIGGQVHWGFVGFATDSQGVDYIVSKNGSTVLSYNGSQASVIIPDKIEGYAVTKIDNEVFYDCDSIESIEMPSSITSIGNYAFHSCGKLKSVTFGENSQLESIGEYAFSICLNLTNIVISSSVTDIGERAFEYCYNLENIVIPSGVTSIGYEAFRDCRKLTIYCEATSQPSGWDADWNSSGRPVYWYIKTQPATEGNYWHYVEGVVTKW